MNNNDLIREISIFVEKMTQEIIVELQQLRLLNDGQFNDHEKWTRNDPRVQEEKGFNKPLYDSGELMRELQTKGNWDLRPTFSNGKLTLTVPDRENFTDSKYDVLDTGGSAKPYVGRRTGKTINVKTVPARPFKDISADDMNWIANKLNEAIKRKFNV